MPFLKKNLYAVCQFINLISQTYVLHGFFLYGAGIRIRNEKKSWIGN